ncbi:MAG TPA: YggS family pyridoxal phosphate enzyme [Acidimicrobiales bacterium]|nr:YggS family pyridoxal phosphate enzyme [Acidimicrobiales bacterium]
MTATTTPFDPEGFAVRLSDVHRRIGSVSSRPDSVRIVAVTKGFGADAVRAALGAGLTDVGENYADELVTKAGLVAPSGDGPRGAGDLQTPPVSPVWHFLGAVQRNKVARLAPLVSWWQGVSRLEEGRAIARRRPGSIVLVQLDVAGIAGRGGCRPDQAAELVAELRHEDLDVAGLMAVGPPGPPEAARAGFARLSALADSLDLPVRSMGMSDDLEVAVAEGSTMVRLGRALFGPRPAPLP